MVTFVVLALYIMGVYTAYHQIQRWAEHDFTTKEDFYSLFKASLLSWVVYPLYGLAYLFKECEGD